MVDSATVGLGCVQFETLREEGKLVWYPGKIFTDPNHSDLDPVEDEGTLFVESTVQRRARSGSYTPAELGLSLYTRSPLTASFLTGLSPIAPRTCRPQNGWQRHAC